MGHAPGQGHGAGLGDAVLVRRHEPCGELWEAWLEMVFLLSVMRIVASGAAVAVLGWAAYWSLRLGYADRLAHTDSPEHVKRATELAPCNARYRARLAAMLDQWGKDRGASVAALEAAVVCNPRDSESWIELGLLAEMDGDFAKAERCLLEAARVDKQYDPPWALANFYFRRNDAEKFWPWAREAAAMSYGDAAPLFRLCWRTTQDPEVILERAIPDQPAALVRYLSFLLADNHLEAVEAAAQRVAGRAGREDLPVLLASCDRLLEGRQFAAALRIWTVLCRRKLVPYQAPYPERGLALTNGDFRTPPLSRGFDWRVHAVEGVSVSQRQSPPALRITFSGRQPESCEVLSQFVPLLPAREYRLRFGYRTSHIAPDTGVHWRILDPATGAELAERSSHLSSDEEIQQEVTFSTPAETRAARLVLMYQRTPGTTRIEGSIFLSHASLVFAPP